MLIEISKCLAYSLTRSVICVNSKQIFDFMSAHPDQAELSFSRYRHRESFWFTLAIMPSIPGPRLRQWDISSPTYKRYPIYSLSRSSWVSRKHMGCSETFQADKKHARNHVDVSADTIQNLLNFAQSTVPWLCNLSCWRVPEFSILKNRLRLWLCFMEK